MVSVLAVESFGNLPLHDSELVAFQLEVSPGGDLACALVLLVNAEEPLTLFSQLGIVGRRVRFSFVGCLQVASDFLGVTTARATVATWEVVAASDLLARLRRNGADPGARLLNYRFSFADGSALDVIAAGIGVETDSGQHLAEPE